MNWRAAEKTLYEAARSVIGRFADNHRNERFYGLVLDLNADYGEVFLSLNTEAGLRMWAADHYPDYSPEEIEQRLRWNPGDWLYHGFNTDEPYALEWEQSWSEYQDRIHDAVLDDDNDAVSEWFLEAACRVLLRLEKSDALMRLNREEYFKTLVIDHDESLEDAQERLARVRVTTV
jgi:hypothetical protein